jgi:hypothetical protein
MAYAAATIYISAATAVILNPHGLFANAYRCLVFVMLVATFFVVHTFIFWQLLNRELAANIVRAANVVLARLASQGATPDMSPAIWRAQALPTELVSELRNPSSGLFLGGPRTATVLTLAATIFWSTLAIFALMC